MLIQNKSRLENDEIKLCVNDTPLKHSSVVYIDIYILYIYVYIYIDDELNWSAHIEYLQKQTNRSTALLLNVNLKVRRTVYYGSIHSHLNCTTLRIQLRK